jgi:hypothetical protein
MTDDPGDWVVTFASIHYVLVAERVLKERGLKVGLIPAPREFSADCGMVLVLPAAEGAAAREILSGPRWGVRAFHRRETRMPPPDAT